METSTKYDLFIAHTASDRLVATKLYRLLARKYRVFLDSETLRPGDRWIIEIPKAQRESLMTLILISHRTAAAYFEQEEIQSAIHLSRLDGSQHRAIPLYLGYLEPPTHVPYGVRQLQAIFVKKKDGIKEASLKIKSFLRRYEVSEQTMSTAARLAETDKRVRTVERKILQATTGARSRKESIGLIFGDIDGFTAINKKYGVGVGDSIGQVIERLFATMRHVISFYKLGGDEFVGCVIGIHAESLPNVAQELLERVNSYFWTSLAPELYVSVSIGIAKLDTDESLRQGLLRAVHGSVLAKRRGGNRVAEGIHTPRKSKPSRTDENAFLKEITRHIS